MVCSNNDAFLRRFRDTATLTVYVTACDLQKSFVFEKVAEITSHMQFPIYVYKQYMLHFPGMWDRTISNSKVTFKRQYH